MREILTGTQLVELAHEQDKKIRRVFDSLSRENRESYESKAALYHSIGFTGATAFGEFYRQHLQ